MPGQDMGEALRLSNVDPRRVFSEARGRPTLPSLVGGGFAVEYEAYLQHGQRSDLQESLRQAKDLGLPALVGTAVIETVMNTPKDTREGQKAAMAQRLAEQAEDINRAVNARLAELEKEKKIDHDQHLDLQGYGAVETMRIAAEYAGAEPSTIPGEVQISWGTVLQKAEQADNLRSQIKPNDRSGFSHDAAVAITSAAVTQFMEGVGEKVGDIAEDVLENLADKFGRVWQPEARVESARVEPEAPKATRPADSEKPTHATPEPAKFTENLSRVDVETLQKRLERSEFGSPEHTILFAEKQKRVDDLDEQFKAQDGRSLKRKTEADIRAALKAATPADYVDFLERVRDEAVPATVNNEEAARLYRIVRGEEIDRVLVKIYTGASKMQDAFVAQADDETVKSIDSRTKKNRVDFGVHIDNPIRILGELPLTFDNWKTQNGSYLADAEIVNRVANYYKARDEQRVREEILLAGRGRLGGYGEKPPANPQEVLNNYDNGVFTDKTVEAWGLPTHFVIQAPHEAPGVYATISVANIFSQIMDVGGSEFLDMMWNTPEFFKIPAERRLWAQLGLAPIMKLCSDKSRKIGDLAGDKENKGSLAAYQVNETSTAKFMLMPEGGAPNHATTLKIFGVIETLSGKKNADEARYSPSLQKFISIHKGEFQGLNRATRAQDLLEQKKKLVVITDALASELGVDRGLTRYCLEFQQLFGEAGLNYDMGRLRQFYLEGASDSPSVLRVLPLDKAAMDKDKQERLVKLRGLIADSNKIISETPDEAKKLERQRYIDRLTIDLVRVGKEDTQEYLDTKIQRIRLARIKTIRGEGVAEGGYLKEKKKVLAETEGARDAKPTTVEKEKLKPKIDKIKTEIALLQNELKLISNDRTGPAYVQGWANDIIARYQGDGLHSFLGVVDRDGNSLEEWESEAIGILNKPIYLRAEESTMQRLRTQMDGIVMEKGAVALAQGLAQGGTEVMVTMISELGTSKVGGSWGAEGEILGTLDKVAGMAYRKDAEYALTDETTLLEEIKKLVDKMRIRQPFTLLAQETFNRLLSLRVVPPVTSSKEAVYLQNQSEAAERLSEMRRPGYFTGLGRLLRGLIPKI